MIEYQSFGGGVNSVALSEVLDHSVEKIMADTGCEGRPTYRYLAEYPHPITMLKGHVEGCNDIEEWCHKLGHAPFRMYRSCSDKWKYRVIEKYYERPCLVYIGIAYDERHRVKIHKKGKITYRYPLVEQKITRNKCKRIILDAGLPVPPKSGCWLCPFQSRGSWWKLAREDPDLFWRAVEIDELSTKIGIYKMPGDLRKLWPPPSTFIIDEDWECQHCFIILREKTDHPQDPIRRRNNR